MVLTSLARLLHPADKYTRTSLGEGRQLHLYITLEESSTDLVLDSIIDTSQLR